MPKEVERSAIAKVVQTQPLLARFLDDRLSVEGGRRGLKPANETEWRVGRLVYRVETVGNAKPIVEQRRDGTPSPYLY